MMNNQMMAMIQALRGRQGGGQPPMGSREAPPRMPMQGMGKGQRPPPVGGMPPQGMPPQGMPPQGMPPQGMPPQGMPPQMGTGKSRRPPAPTMGQPMSPPPNQSI